MLTRIRIRNFKRFGQVDIELGSPVVFIGPNNSGKITALQALGLWGIGLKRWTEKRRGKTPEKRPGVTINRRDLIAVPVPDSNLLWRNLHVRDVQTVNGKPQTKNIRIDIVVDGVTGGASWSCGLEFDYANEESFYCRPLRVSEDESKPERMPIPDQAAAVRMAFLPPMSGLTANETRLDPGAIDVRIGEGRTAEVLRNLCYQIASGEGSVGRWRKVTEEIHGLFGVSLEDPRYIPERGEIEMGYRDLSGSQLDLSSSGRGLQQTLLLLAHLSLNPGSVLLLDEPDAHLEILRQRQIYELLSTVAKEGGSQVVAASHSEIILNEAADRDVVVAFVGIPHRIDDRGSQALKSLRDIGFDQYYQAEQTGWVLYLEGATDLAILKAFAGTLGHRASAHLERPFVSYVLDRPSRARMHFYGLREAKANLVGLALFDRIDEALQEQPELKERKWTKREIENYFCRKDVLLAWARNEGEHRTGGPLFGAQWEQAMQAAIGAIETALTTLGRPSPWGDDLKVSDEFLTPLFERFFEQLNLPNLMRKTDFHVLARYIPANLIHADVIAVLDNIAAVADAAKPSG